MSWLNETLEEVGDILIGTPIPRAKEATAIAAENSKDVLLRRACKNAILAAAQRGQHITTVEVAVGTPSEIVAKQITELQDHGYTVSTPDRSNVLKIVWPAP